MSIVTPDAVVCRCPSCTLDVIAIQTFARLAVVHPTAARRKHRDESIMSTHEPLPIRHIHHLGRLTKRLAESRRFYREILGFREIERPNFNFPGAWLFNYGVQIHLIENARAGDPQGEIETRIDHLALYSDDLDRVEQLLQAHGIPYRTNFVADTQVKQLFFRDPDGHHIEVAHYPPTPRFLDVS